MTISRTEYHAAGRVIGRLLGASWRNGAYLKDMDTKHPINASLATNQCCTSKLSLGVCSESELCSRRLGLPVPAGHASKSRDSQQERSARFGHDPVLAKLKVPNAKCDIRIKGVDDGNARNDLIADQSAKDARLEIDLADQVIRRVKCLQ